MQHEPIVARGGRDQGHRPEVARAGIQCNVEIEGRLGCWSCCPGSDGYVGGHESQERLRAEPESHCVAGNLTTRSIISSPRLTRSGNQVPAGWRRIAAMTATVLVTGRPATSTN